MGGSLLTRFLSGEQGSIHTNWSGNYEYSTRKVHFPQTAEDVQDVVTSCRLVKALGSRHSFNGIADTTGDQVSLQNLKHMELDRKSRTVAVGAGVRYGDLAPYLDKSGFALHNLASLPHISVAGACATATHGSGNSNGNLSTAVSAMEMIGADGRLTVFSRERDGGPFHGAVVGLGALGVVTKIILNIVPTYEMRQVVYENLSFDRLKDHLNEIFGIGYSVSLFTDWQNHRATQVWIKSRVDGSEFHIQPDFFGATAATRKLHPIGGHPAENCTEQMGIPGPWYERLPHFRMNFTPSSGTELQSEYFVPRERGYEAILAVESLRDEITPHLYVTEFRTIDADELWMSPCYQRPAMTIHFTWKPEWPAVKNLLPKIEAQLAPFGARPHWAKLFTIPASRLRSLYPKVNDFEQLVRQSDPQRKFRNQFLDTELFKA